MTQGEPATSIGDPRTTEVGSVFVSNYPPYSVWGEGQVQAAEHALASAPQPETPLGLYLHIPFCRRRCKFCYFKVYTDKNSAEVEKYLDGLAKEIELHSKMPAIAGRPLKFVYFGGGTPSFISGRHLRSLVERVKARLPWDQVEEVAFECEPGTLTEKKLQTIRELGITRISLGVENFNDKILADNGRAHVSKEIYRVAPWIKALDFEQVNIDLIAGMVGETTETWKESVRKTVEMDPDSVTIYQMELPYNTVYSRQVLDGEDESPVADWATKRRWNEYAIDQLGVAGYEVSSAYTMVKRGRPGKFVYRDSVWHGCDLLGTGVASFSHVNGVHFQNASRWDVYLGKLAQGDLPLDRAYTPTADERVTREMILQFKLGRLDVDYFQKKFGVDLLAIHKDALDRLAGRDMLHVDGRTVVLSRQGLLRVDTLLPEFYDPKYRGARYT